jgi:hypothetical protein
MQHRYARRAERGILDYWDDRYAISDEHMSELFANVEYGQEPTPFDNRRLFPIAPFRYLVMLSYWAVAAAALWNGKVIWSLRDELTFSTDPESTIDQILQSVAIFIAALFAMQVVQGLWSIGQAWNAQRATLSAPRPLGMAVLFGIGPVLLALAFSLNPDFRLPFVVLAILVNLVAWGLSFNLLARTVESLGRSTAAIRAWGGAVSIHWMLSFASRPLDVLDDQQYAVAVVALSVLDAGIFFFASVMAWKAMKDFEAATAEHDQIRRI